jgi:hypothetical protein
LNNPANKTALVKNKTMKKSFLLVIIAAFSIFILTSCSKKNDASPAALPDYSHLITGSSWTYKSTENTTSKNYTLTVTSKDTTANQKTYKVLSSSDGGPNSYISKVDNNYYRFVSYPALGINSFEELYLKSNEALNATWANQASLTFMGTPLTVNLKYTIKAKDESRTVLTKAYNKVMYVRLDISVFGATAGGGDFYYAEGVGLIESSILIPPPFGPYSLKQELVSSDLK